jgi:hypothetical protein
MLRHVAHVRTNISEKRVASIIRVTKISELGTTSAVTSKSNIYIYIIYNTYNLIHCNYNPLYVFKSQ